MSLPRGGMVAPAPVSQSIASGGASSTTPAASIDAIAYPVSQRAITGSVGLASGTAALTPQGGFDLETHVVPGLVDAPSPGFGRRGRTGQADGPRGRVVVRLARPFGTDDGEKHVAPAHGLGDFLTEVDAQPHRVDVLEYIAAAEDGHEVVVDPADDVDAVPTPV